MPSKEEADDSFVCACAAASGEDGFAADAAVGTLEDPGMALNPWEPVVIVATGPPVGLWAAEPDAIGVGVSDLGVSGGDVLDGDDVPSEPVGDAVFVVAAEKRIVRSCPSTRQKLDRGRKGCKGMGI